MTYNMNQQEDGINVNNIRVFLEYPRGTQLCITYDDKVPEYGTVIGHQLGYYGVMLLMVSVVRPWGEESVSINPADGYPYIIDLQKIQLVG